MEKFVSHFTTPKQFALMPNTTEQSSQREQPLGESAHASPVATSPVQENPLEGQIVEREASAAPSENQDLLHIRELQEKHGRHDNKLARDAMLRLQAYKAKYGSEYQAHPEILGRNLEETAFDKISETDSRREVDSDEADETYDWEM